MVVSTINKESFKEPMTSYAAAADICKTALSHLVNFWSCVCMKVWEIMRPKQTTRENTLSGKLGAEEKVPPPPSLSYTLPFMMSYKPRLPPHSGIKQKNFNLNFIQ